MSEFIKLVDSIADYFVIAIASILLLPFFILFLPFRILYKLYVLIDTGDL